MKGEAAEGVHVFLDVYITGTSGEDPSDCRLKRRRAVMNTLLDQSHDSDIMTFLMEISY